MHIRLFPLLLILFAYPAAAINTSSGESTYTNSALSNTVAAVKTTPGIIYGYNFVNKGVADAWVQFFDVASASVTPGTTAPKLSLWLPAGGGFEEKQALGIAFGTAISIIATTASTGGSAPATAIVANVFYK